GNNPHEIGAASFIFMRRLFPVNLFPGDNLYCSASRIIRVSLEEKFPGADEDTGTERGIDFMSGENQEIYPVFLHVYRFMGYQLGSIHQEPCSILVTEAADFPDGINIAGYVGGTCYCNQPYFPLILDQFSFQVLH